MAQAIVQISLAHIFAYFLTSYTLLYVHNGIIPAMANRIFSTNCDNFQLIEASDISKAFEKFNPKATELKPRHRVVGFTA